ncbi:MAG: DUF4369 domain-containing protein [Bacteroidales bacterium]|jgi:hypothetical protein|nr:DUF4369 domain-containing protein [Bacteroidales bacterium]
MSKQLILYLIVGFLLAVSCNRAVKDNEFSLNGALKQSKEMKLVLSELDTNGYKTLDTIKTDKNGAFKKYFSTKNENIYRLSLSDNDFIVFIAKAKDVITIKANVGSFSSTYKIEGSKTSEELQKLNSENIATRQQFAMMKEQLLQSRGTENEQEVREQIKQKYNLLHQQEREFTLKFIDENIGNLASVIALYRTFDGQWLVMADELEIYNKVLDGLKKTMPNNPQTIYLENCIKKNEKLVEHIKKQQNDNRK